jgi:ABC-type amino acid transport substrate-binding protein
MKNKKLLLISLFLFALFPMFVGNVNADTSLSDITAAGKIKIATSSGYTPFEDYDAVKDELYGFDIAIGEYIGEQMGVTVEWSDVGFATILNGLENDDYDCVLAAVSITPEREAEADFTRWYFESEQAVLVTVANPKSIENITDVDDAAIKVGYQTGTTSNWYALDNLAADPYEYDTVPLAISDLKAGSIDVVLCDYAVAFSAEDQNDDLQIVDTFSKEYFGIPVKTGDDALRGKLNDILNALLGDDPDNPEISKEYNEIYEEWIGAPAPGYEEFKIPGFSLIALAIAVPLGIGITARKRKK